MQEITLRDRFFFGMGNAIAFGNSKIKTQPSSPPNLTHHTNLNNR
ncbi:MAG: hypothetical protein WBV73_00335 [Phormidium sp.]